MFPYHLEVRQAVAEWFYHFIVHIHKQSSDFSPDLWSSAIPGCAGMWHRGGEAEAASRVCLLDANAGEEGPLYSVCPVLSFLETLPVLPASSILKE